LGAGIAVLIPASSRRPGSSKKRSAENAENCRRTQRVLHGQPLRASGREREGELLPRLEPYPGGQAFDRRSSSPFKDPSFEISLSGPLALSRSHLMVFLRVLLAFLRALRGRS
jgi:hypothetical protein